MRQAVLFGKLPTHGDFVARGLGTEQRDFLDRWLSASLVAAREHAGDGFDALYDTAPPWRYAQLLNGQATGGIVAASIDSAGRRFPLLLGIAGLGPESLAPAAERCEDLVHEAFRLGWQADELRRAVETVDLPPDASPIAVADGLWWTEGAEHQRPVVWTGRFPAGLLTMMLSGEAGSDEFRH